MQVHKISLGNTLTPLGCQLRQLGTDGLYAGVNLAGLTVKFTMIAEDGTVVVAETATGVTVVTAATGYVQYDFQAADVDVAGTFYGYFNVYSGTEFDTYPAEERQLKIVIGNRI